MESKQFGQKFKKREVRNTSIYERSLLTRNITLPISAIGKNIHDTIEKNIAIQFEGRCVVEGYIQAGSSKIITYSSGLISGNNVKFEVVFECKICCPVEGMLVQCIAKNITKAGIRAESADETPSPIVVFITRDHHYMSQYFTTIQENSNFTARIIGQRFELNDKYVSIIAELVDPTKEREREKRGGPARPRLVLKN